MKIIVKNLFILFVWWCAETIMAQNLLIEDFLYDPVDSLENQGSWFRSGSNTEYNIKVVSVGLNYSDYVGSGKGNSCLIENSGNGDVLLHNLKSKVESGDLYMSFMFRTDSLAATMTEGYPICFDQGGPATNNNTRLFIKRESDAIFQLGVSKYGESTSYINANFEIGKTYLIVLKYSYLAGTDNDVSSLYVFETGIPALEPAQPDASNNHGEDMPDQGQISLSNNYAQSGLEGCKIFIDGIRVGTSWETSVLSMISSLESNHDKDQLAFQFYPNPITVHTTIRIHTPYSGEAQLIVFDTNGRPMENLNLSFPTSGTYDIPWNKGLYSPGEYFCKLKFGAKELTHKLLIQN
ncbi:MAG: T9SS type A sorting domain-containing protein [Saprospiraceae bacterium]|nr:T9SS type A sorting domain-containing protein [Saprospiraceae bacterium]